MKNTFLMAFSLCNKQNVSFITELKKFFFDLGADKGVWLAPRPGRFTPWKETRYPLYRRLGGPQGVWTSAENLVPTRIFFSFSIFLYSLLHPYLCLCLHSFCLHLRHRIFCSLSVLYPYFFVLNVLAFPFRPYCTTHTTQTSMPPAGFKPAIPAGDRQQTLALDRSATGIGRFDHRTASSRYTD